MGAVSTQLMPISKPRRSVAIDSSSSCAPHACHQPAPPMAQAPMPTRVMRMPVRPSSTVLKPVVVMDVNANLRRARRGRTAAKHSRLRRAELGGGASREHALQHAVGGARVARGADQAGVPRLGAGLAVPVVDVDARDASAERDEVVKKKT